ncbi:hypothetical protein BTN50_0637 [Candidatus Enterovibrio altilux]|uniref:Uncharacterized protein n=1 Tax=Candidatus Enterovibrio altilux TaxID=1927128 RepID=A0A291B810_9GAMM|nr:hypothetical protein BTN50_0637 [Candidatus Enterovibrio luxaltus]
MLNVFKNIDLIICNTVFVRDIKEAIIFEKITVKKALFPNFSSDGILT